LTNTQAQTTGNEAAFGFVRSLAAELSSGRVELPSFPEVVIRVRRILTDANSTVDKVVRVVGSEPALAARLMRIANSASLNTSGKPITDLRTAINRMGYNMVRSASMTFAMAQIRDNARLASVKPYLDELWERCSLTAAFSYVVARTCTRLNADEAMLTGMMHAIGKLYILTRVADHPELFASVSALNEVIDDWHAEIGKAILENWDFADEMVQAVGNQNDLDRTLTESADLSDVVAVAILMASFREDPAVLAATLEGLPAVGRLRLDAARLEIVMKDFATEVAALRSALGA
jgi:HD-like signal output (HDOD) protein